MKRFGLVLLRALRLSCSALALAALAAPAAAQDKYPSKPVKIIVPYAPGGATDITARLFGEQLRNILGQQFVVESKPGAFGVLAIEEMARAKPDGYTLMIGNVSTNAITPVLFKNKFSIDFDKSVVSVSRLAIYPSFLITTTKNLDVKSTAELVAHAKKNPGKVKFTSAGIGSFPHFDMEIFAQRAGVDMVHIPNKAGAAGMINDLVVGDVEAADDQRGEHRRDDQGRQPAADRRAGRGSGSPTIPTSRRSPKPAIRVSARCTGRACSRPPARRRRCSRPCTRRSSKPRRRRSCRRRSRSSWSASSRTPRSRTRSPGSTARSPRGRRSSVK